MSAASEFPPEKVRAVVSEVASLLKERKETVSVAETVCRSSLISTYDLFIFPLKFPPLWLLTFHNSFTRGILYKFSKGRIKEHRKNVQM
jgi:hypothetical protein